MSYQVYKSLSSEEVFELRKSLKSLESGMSRLLADHQFYISKESLNGDHLGLDYLFEVGNVFGNIGVKFLDERIGNDFLFSFYVLKAYDRDGVRYYRRDTPHEGGILLDALQRGYRVYVDACISVFHDWTLDDLTEEIKLL